MSPGGAGAGAAASPAGGCDLSAWLGTFSGPWSVTASFTSPAGAPPATINSVVPAPMILTQVSTCQLNLTVGGDAATAQGSISESIQNWTLDVSGSQATLVGTHAFDGNESYQGLPVVFSGDTTSGTAVLNGGVVTFQWSGPATGTTNGVPWQGSYVGTWTATRTTSAPGATGGGTPVGGGAPPGGSTGGSGPAIPALDTALAGSWPYQGGFFYPDPVGTPGVDISNPPTSLRLGTDGTFTMGTTSGSWSTGQTTAADWQAWGQQYNFPEKITLTASGGPSWTGYVDDGDPSGETTGPANCVDLFYRQSSPAGRFWIWFCHQQVKQ